MVLEMYAYIDSKLINGGHGPNGIVGISKNPPASDASDVQIHKTLFIHKLHAFIH